MDYEMRYLQRRPKWDMPSYVPKAETSIPKEEELFEARSLPERDMFEDCPFKSRTIA